MKRSEMERLQREELPNDANCREQEFERTIGVPSPNLNKLGEALWRELEDGHRGFRSWAGHLDPVRSTLISDYLVQVTNSAKHNLVEAQLHLFELQEAWERHDEQHARMIQPHGIQAPQIRSAWDMILDRMIQLHIGGVFRALGSTLDCLSGIVLGVAAVPDSILRADFLRTLRWFEAASKKDGTCSIHRDFYSFLAKCVDSAGPRGWLEWVDGYRNMFVHRARRLMPYQISGESYLLGVDRQPIIRTISSPVLNREPRLSDIEALKLAVDQPMENLFLSENAKVTLNEALKSTLYLVETVAGELHSLWDIRKKDLNLLKQPKEQWPRFPNRTPDRFQGYDPKSIELKVDTILTSPAWQTRLKSAALSDDQIQEWDDDSA